MAAAGAGLEGIVATDSKICFIDGGEGVLSYQGFDIRTLGENASFEETIFLLWNGRLPKQAELDAKPSQPAYVLKLEGFSESLETSDETAVDSLEPELADISSDRSVRELVIEETVKRVAETEATTFDYLRRPEFRVDPAAQADFEAELLMTPEEADSLLSSRYVCPLS